MNVTETISRIAEAVADGAAIDWEQAERDAANAEERAAIRALRRIGDTAAARRLLSSQSLGSGRSTARPVAARAPESGEDWGQLRVAERIGGGGFADVYRAWDTRLDREVALKLLRRLDASEDAAGTIIEEGRRLARIKHHNVVAVHGADRIGGRVGIWMELVSGRSLHEIVSADGPLSAAEACLIGIELCRALAAVHGQGLVHRDVKPQNIMREHAGRIVLMDLGAAHDLDHGVAPPAGTPLFMAPELFGGASESPQSDVYSAGAVLFFLVTGQYPIAATTLPAVREAHERGERRHLTDHRPDIPGPFLAVVERALDAEPSRRFETAGKMERALREAAEAVAGASAVVEPPARASAIRRPFLARITEGLPGTRRSWMAAGLALMAAGALYGAGAWRTLLDEKVPAADTASEAASRLDVLPGFVFGSPSGDGRYLAYVEPEGHASIAQSATGQSRRIIDAGEGSGAAGGVVLSFDGSRAAVSWSLPDRSWELRLVDTDDTWPWGAGAVIDPRPHVTLLRSAALEPLFPIDWSADHASILASIYRLDGSVELVLAAADGSGHRVLQQFRGIPPRRASLSPDGRFVVYDVPAALPAARRDILIARTDGTEPPRVLVGDPADDGVPLWAPDGRSIVFVSDRRGGADLWQLPVERGMASGRPRRIARSMEGVTPFRITAGGDYYYALQTTHEDVTTVELDGRGAAAGAPALLPGGSALPRTSPVWSPDGRTVAHFVLRGRNLFDNASFVRFVDEKGRRLRDVVPRLAYYGRRPLRWSPDGRALLIHGKGLDGYWGIHAVDVLTGIATTVVRGDRPVLDENFGPVGWGRTGQTVMYVRRGLGLFERDVDGGDERQVMTTGRSEFITDFGLSPDGRRLAFSLWNAGKERPGSTLAIREADGTIRTIRSAAATARIQFHAWTPDGRGLLFGVGEYPKNSSLAIVPASGGEPLYIGVALEPGARVSLRPDGRALAYDSGRSGFETWRLRNVVR